MNTNGPGGHRRRRRQGRGAQDLRAPGAAVDTTVLAGTGFGEHKRSLIETAILTALTEQSGHGYALIERVQQLIAGQLQVDPGSVYRILRLLEEAGMISSSWEVGLAGPRRRTYTIEPPGRELLRSWIEVLADRGNALLDLSRLAQERLG